MSQTFYNYSFRLLNDSNEVYKLRKSEITAAQVLYRVHDAETTFTTTFDFNIDEGLNTLWVRLPSGDLDFVITLNVSTLRTITTGLATLTFGQLTTNYDVQATPVPLNSKQGYSPRILNDFWYEYDDVNQTFVNTGYSAKGTVIPEAVQVDDFLLLGDVNPVTSNAVKVETNRLQAQITSNTNTIEQNSEAIQSLSEHKVSVTLNDTTTEEDTNGNIALGNIQGLDKLYKVQSEYDIATLSYYGVDKKAIVEQGGLEIGSYIESGSYGKYYSIPTGTGTYYRIMGTIAQTNPATIRLKISSGSNTVAGTIFIGLEDNISTVYCDNVLLQKYIYCMAGGSSFQGLYIKAMSDSMQRVQAYCSNFAFLDDEVSLYSGDTTLMIPVSYGLATNKTWIEIYDTPFVISQLESELDLSVNIPAVTLTLPSDLTYPQTIVVKNLQGAACTLSATGYTDMVLDDQTINYITLTSPTEWTKVSTKNEAGAQGIKYIGKDTVYAIDAQGIINIPTTMVNPNAMTIGGKTYDGSAAVDVTLTDLDTYSKEEINEKLTYVIKYEKVTALPETGVVGTIYLVPKTDTGTQDLYDEYMYVDSTWEKIGSVDMSNYYTKTDIDTKLADYPSIYPKQTYTLNVEAGQGTTYPYYIRKCLYSCPTYGTSTIHIVTAYGDSSLAWQPYHVYDNIISNYYENINHPAPYSLSGPYLCYDTSIDDFGQEFSSKVNLYYEANSDNSVCYVNIGFRVDNATEVNKLVVDIQPIFIPTNIITQYPLTYKTLVVFPEHTPGNVTSSVHSLGYTLYRMEGANSSVETKANAAQTKANSAYTLAQRKQDQLTAGDNITIVDNVISSTGGSGSGDVTTVGLTTDYLPKASAAKAIIDSAWSEGRLNNLKSIIESLTTDAITLTSDTTFVANNVTYSVNTPVTTTYDIASISASGATVEVLHGNPHKITDTALANIKVLNMRYAYIGNNPYFGTWLSAKTGLETVVLPEDSGSIYYNQFFMTSAIKNVTTFNNTFLTATSLWKMCLNCTSLLVFTIGRTPVCTTMAEAFSSCSSLTTLTLTNAGSEILDSAYQLALNCTSLNTVDMQNFIFGSSSHPCNTGLMFKGCTVLASVDLTNANMTYANTGYELFMGCAGLTSLHINNSSLPAFTTATTFMEMFSGCTSLVEVDLSSVVAANINSAYAMFLNCSALTTLTLPTGWCNTVDLGYAKSLSQTSIANLATALASGVTDKSLTFDATIYAAIPARVVSTITGKGWTITTVTY